MSAPARIPPAAVAHAIFAGVISTSALDRLAAPSARPLRRRMLETPGFREELRSAGWRRTQIRTWLRTGDLPERAS